MFQLREDEKRKAILSSTNHLLIMGGPGSGKTTVALFKAKQIAESQKLMKGQKILFLSFARATISRVEEQAGSLIPDEVKDCLEINTYHGFIWSIIKHHGYLLSEKPIRLLPPHEATQYLNGMKGNSLHERMEELFREEGLLHFDLFAETCAKLFSQSNSLRRIISQMYPVLILDEFQDTNSDEWNLVQTLGKDCRLIVLADPDQRIYDFRGADSKRITQFIETYGPDVYDFGKENNRSNGTDIVQFGNDLLSNANKGKTYKDVDIYSYPYRAKPYTNIYVKLLLLKSIKRLRSDSTDDWSIAVLVPTNALMLEVSDTLQREHISNDGKKYPSISHDVAVDSAGPSLAALCIAYLLESGSLKVCNVNEILKRIIEHISGRKNNSPLTQKDTETITWITRFLETSIVRGKNRTLLIEGCKQIAECVNTIAFTGNIISDWKAVAGSLYKGKHDCINNLANDSRYIRLLQRGTQLFSALDIIWRENGSYAGAVDAVSNALLQEHFALSTRKWTGVNVMTIHKAKGKEFDEVIVYEGLYQNRIVSKPERINQARLNLRVAVTRAKKHATILTPENDPCPLI